MTWWLKIGARLRRFFGRLRCRWAKRHFWLGDGPPVQRPGHRGGYAPAVCARCEERTTMELSREQLAEAKRRYLEASKLRVVR